MISARIRSLRKKYYDYGIDGYIVPKNDEFFGEYSNQDRLKIISGFDGSAGLAVILKDKNYLFVDGRYTIQAKKQSGKKFRIMEIPNIFPKDLFIIENYKIGFNPKLFTDLMLKRYFGNKTKLIPVEFLFKNKNKKNVSKVFHLNKYIVGESSSSKINKVKKYMERFKINYLYISASENVNWLLNIRGKDLPNSPLVNCKLIIPENGKQYLFINQNKISNLIRKYFKNINLCQEEDLLKVISKLNSGSFCIDKTTCSLFEEGIINSKFNVYEAYTEFWANILNCTFTAYYLSEGVIDDFLIYSE